MWYRNIKWKSACVRNGVIRDAKRNWLRRYTSCNVRVSSRQTRRVQHAEWHGGQTVDKFSTRLVANRIAESEIQINFLMNGKSIIVRTWNSTRFCAVIYVNPGFCCKLFKMPVWVPVDQSSVTLLSGFYRKCIYITVTHAVTELLINVLFCYCPMAWRWISSASRPHIIYLSLSSRPAPFCASYCSFCRWCFYTWIISRARHQLDCAHVFPHLS